MPYTVSSVIGLIKALFTVSEIPKHTFEAEKGTLGSWKSE